MRRIFYKDCLHKDHVGRRLQASSNFWPHRTANFADKLQKFCKTCMIRDREAYKKTPNGKRLHKMYEVMRLKRRQRERDENLPDDVAIYYEREFHTYIWILYTDGTEKKIRTKPDGRSLRYKDRVPSGTIRQ